VLLKTEELSPALMQGELDCSRRLPPARFTKSGELVKFPVPLANGVVQE